MFLVLQSLPVSSLHTCLPSPPSPHAVPHPGDNCTSHLLPASSAISASTGKSPVLLAFESFWWHQPLSTKEPPISLTKFCFLLDNTPEAPAVPFGSQLCPSAGLTSPCLRGDLACTQLWFFQVRTNSGPNPGQPSAHTRVSTNTSDWPSEAWVGFPGPCPSFPL